MAWRRATGLVVAIVFCLTMLGGCLQSPAIVSQRVGLQASGPFDSALERSGHLLGEGATWQWELTYRERTEEGPIVYETACDGALHVRLAKAEEAADRVPPSSLWDQSVDGPDLEWRAPPSCDQESIPATLQPGEAVTASWTWDGMLWDADAEAYVEAEAGTYAWQATWEGRFEDPSGSGDSANSTATVVFTFGR